jgi:hypothetical protein
MEQTITSFEKDMLDVVNKVIHEFSERFNSKGIQITSKFESNKIPESYFSEIELDFWKGGNLVDAMSLIIFINGQKYMDLFEADTWLKNEFSITLNKC